ncbi:hypothetical protein [Umezawaea sp. Da 62-37]|uniref:hypothetical protein n=1 Tax=Umezawaea sp. Da 62-37 TaxID=3075927 RepID=UPI0028F71654|nr:hypothetical protein [Umezawaea sp. Da 62-37]WNV85577.1 hypothetical protein RM788_46915 [Umezawaea sp. Da 62-37]
MNDLGEGRGRAAAARLLDVAGPDMYLRNPFRVTGLATGATGRQVRERRQLVLSALAAGAAARVGDTRLPVPTPPSADDLRAAFDRLDKTEFRLVDELFWWWGEPGGCGCAEVTHRLHDEAVAAHAEVLDLEGIPGSASALKADKWAVAARAWASALLREEMWAHLEHRVAALADRRLDKSTVDGIRGSIAHALLAPQVALAATSGEPGRVAKALERWEFDRATLDDARNAAAAHSYDQVELLCAELAGWLEDGRVDETVDRIFKELVPAASRLDQLVPHGRFRRSAVARNRVAVVVNNTGLVLMEVPAEAKGARVERLLTEAEGLAVDDDTKTVVRNNQELWRTERSLVAATGSATPWNAVNTLLAEHKYLSAMPLLLKIRDVAKDPLSRRSIQGTLNDIRAIRAAGRGRDRSPVAGNVMAVAFCVASIGVLGVLLGLVFEPGPGSAIVVGVLAPVVLAFVYTDWFMSRPMQITNGGGAACLLAAIGFDFVLAYLADMGSVPHAGVVFVFALFYARPIGRALARRWDDR